MKYRHPYARRGSGYLLVLGAAMLVSVIGLTALMASRIEHKSQQATLDSARARVYARSAVEMAMAFTYRDAEWRSNYSTFKAMMPMTLDRGACSIAMTQLNGAPLSADEDDDVLLTGTGVVGTFAKPQAVYKWSVAAQQPPLDLLRTAAHANGAMFVSGTVNVEDGPLSTNQTLTNSGTLNGDVEARVISNSGTINGTRTTNAPAKQMPSSSLLDYYRSRASTISNLLVGSVMDWNVLCPQYNPYGFSNSNGLYYVKPSSNFTIRNYRIVGTLIVELASGKTLTLEQGLLWEPARPDYPALIVVGNCQMWTASTLNESNYVNFNPSWAPYQGSYDTDRTDLYPSSIKGIVHVMGANSTTSIYASTRIMGTIVAEGDIYLYNGASLNADLNLLERPPQQYRVPWLAIEPGTWTRVIP